MISTVVLTTSANAAYAWYTCTVNTVGTYGSTVYINLTDTGGNFSNRNFIPYTGQENRQMATALTALSNDFFVIIYADYNLSQASRKLYYFGISVP
jgi:hypothetical protein